MVNKALYDLIGRDYDTTRQADPHITHRLVDLLQITPGGSYLDLACGTGNYTGALAACAGNMVGIDRSPGMIQTAMAKARSIGWCIGDAESLPFPDGAFDGALCTLAIHHFPRPEAAYAEVFRVLHTGRFLIFTATPEQMRCYWLNAYFPTAMAASIAHMPTFQATVAQLQRAGFPGITCEPYAVRDDLRDLFLYSGKHYPALYLDPRVRSGISTFATAPNSGEIEKGCARLARDIESGEIERVRAAYEHASGDYLFVVAEKP